MKKKQEIIGKLRRAAGCSDNEMYGIKVPKLVKQALQLDKENGNDLWAKAIKKEMDALYDMCTFKFVHA